jgi:chromosome segregation ATPase
MSDFVTKNELDKALQKQTDEIVGLLQTFMQASSDRFDSIDQRFERIETDLRAINDKYDHLINTIDGFIGRIDHYETEMAARDRQMERLLAWARKVSEKTGIPLEDL